MFKAIRVVAASFAIGLAALSVIPARAATVWNVGDVFVGVSGGQYQVYDNTGVLKETISDGLGGFTTGCAFNTGLDKLYTTNFSNTKVKVYDDPSPHPIVQTVDPAADSPGVANSESVVFAANGDYYVGHAGGNADVVKYNSAGVFQQAFDVADDNIGSDWIDLAADQKTLFYTSEGRHIQRYDVSTSTQLADFALLPGPGEAFALRLLSPGDGSGGLLVADGDEVKRLDGTGAVVQTYDVAGHDNWFALNLDPNGTSFWSGDFSTGNFFRFNIATGAIEVGPINTGTGSFTLFGICVKGEITAATPDLTLDPPSATNPAGTNHTVTATLKAGNNPVPNTLINFKVTAGPNTGQVSDPGECTVDPNCMTDANGQTSWTYLSNGSVGTDVIQACFTDQGGKEHCVEAKKTWVDDTPPVVACTETTNPHGKNVPKASNQNQDGFYQLTAKDNVDPSVQIFVSNLSGTYTFGAYNSGDNIKLTEAPGAVPSEKKMGSGNGQANAVVAHITLDTDAVVTATDAAGNTTTVSCLVPPPPR